ncbi:hypothetical protein CWS02_13040 [Enterobacter sp. EA-1]|nr:hypothetical protein CWS02_13040 [Enterobacter sp. EA-1]
MVNQIGNTYKSHSHAADTRSMATRSESSITSDITNIHAESPTKTNVVFSSLAQQLSNSAGQIPNMLDSVRKNSVQKLTGYSNRLTELFTTPIWRSTPKNLILPIPIA